MHNLLLFLLGFFGCAGGLILLEAMARRFNWDPENVRRLSHVFSALFAAVMSTFFSPAIFIAVVAMFIPLIWLSHRRNLLRHIHEVSRPTIGAELLPLGFLVTYIITGGDTAIFIPAVLVVGIADPITGVVMQKYNSHILGIVAFIIAATIILLFCSIAILPALVIACIAAVIERISIFGTDNLTIPIVVALALGAF